MSRILVRKQDGPKIAPTIGSGGAGISFILGGSGQPGLGRAIGSGAMSGYYGSAGLEDFAARLGQRFGRKLSDKNPRITASNRLLADPKVTAEQRYQDSVNEFEAGRDSNITPSSPPPDFTEIAEPNARLMPPPPTANPPTANPPTAKKPVRVIRGDAMPDIESDFGPPLADDPEFNYNRMVGDFS